MPRCFTTLIGILALVLASQLHAFMSKDTSYSAIRHIESTGSDIAIHAYHVPGKERMEFTPGAGGPMITAIIRIDRQLTWLLIPQMNAYMEASIKRYASQTPGNYTVLKYKKLGTEMVNGYRAIKYHAHVRTQDGAEGSGYYWIVNDSIPIKMDLDVTTDKDKRKTQHVLMELRNLKIGPQDPSLFELPAGYSKMSISSISNAVHHTLATPVPTQTNTPASTQTSVVGEIEAAATDKAKNSMKDEVKEAVGNFVHGLFH